MIMMSLRYSQVYYSVSSKVSNRSGDCMQNLQQKSTRKSMFLHENELIYFECFELCKKSFPTVAERSRRAIDALQILNRTAETG